MQKEFYRVMGKMITENGYRNMSVLEFVSVSQLKSNGSVPDKDFRKAYYDLLRDEGLTETLWSN